jgi:16S rRNA processing protein RimM
MIAIGKITGHFGYKGEVKVMPLTDFPERFKQLKIVNIKSNGRVFTMEVESVRNYAHGLILKLSDIDDKETAEAFCGGVLQVDETQVYPLPRGYYYHFQLRGLKVYDDKRGFLGILADIIETGANDVYVVESEHYPEILIPAIKQVIKAIDLQAETMQVDLLPGIIDDEG